MKGNTILVTTDFTETAKIAENLATIIAKDMGADIVVFHVQEKGEDEAKCNFILKNKVEGFKENDVEARAVLLKGKVNKVISDEASRSEYFLNIIATHGKRGIQQNLFGAHIHKIAQQSKAPTLVVQEHTDVNEFSHILLPIGSHDNFLNIVNATLLMARVFGSTLHLFIANKRDGKPTEKESKNLTIIKDAADIRGIKYVETFEDVSNYNQGVTEYTLEYARKNKINLIALMAASMDMGYTCIAIGDKEAVINNAQGIPTLLAQNAK